MNKKTASVKVLLTPEKKKLWKEYCDVHQCGLTLSSLVEYAVDEKITNKTEYRDRQAASGWYWVVKPQGKQRDVYNAEVMMAARQNIERKRHNNETRALELGSSND